MELRFHIYLTALFYILRENMQSLPEIETAGS